ncbi:cap-specific mRNA (nucleoside-2'-O-)-methyltransferase 1-like [Stegodyphus dumicola]|uniref:cap-specific mRNA (nucleoside-2'-O-)-methyltransferase 1-like n=1 Tax=Stegodyphus dumicola TaxID=202533 RepID=UPI0015ADA157|nr:cap-specific mRNA (nucleoside-2'-O-)-methyltransferase 1-like [Stegodyphus dumicola]
MQRSYIYQYDPQNFKWSKVEVTLELPADTLFYGELVSELRGEGRAQRKITCLHIIDAICLGGKDVRKQHYENRMLLAAKLAKAVSKPSRSDYTYLRVKKVWLLSEIDQIFENLTMKYTKNSMVPRLCYDLGDGRHILPTGLLIFKTTQDPWVTAYSKTNRKKYLFNTRENVSFFERQEAANANFQSCFSKRFLWSWEKGVQLIPEQNTDGDISAVHGAILIKFVQSQLRRMKGC